MANIPILDGTGGTAYLNASGAGTNLDPFIPTHAASGTLAISAGTVGVSSGTVSITGTPTITGTVGVSSGTVGISGTANVSIAAGTVAVSNFPAAQTVQGTVAVSAGTMTITPITWTPFYTVGTASGAGTPISAPGLGSAIWLQELVVVSSQAITNKVLIQFGTVTYKEVPTAAVMDGAMFAYNYPDYTKLPVNTALVYNLSASGTVAVYGRYCIQAG